MENLGGKTAVVTGGGSGIGAGIARAAAAAGMKVVVSDIDQELAAAVAQSIISSGGDAIAVKTDVSDLASVEALRDAALKAFGAVHLVCNNAGVWVGAMMADTRPTGAPAQNGWPACRENLFTGVARGVGKTSPAGQTPQDDKGTEPWDY